MAELGMLLPIILILVLGIIEVTAGFHAYVTVVSSARDGARIGAKGAATDAQIQALVVRDLGNLRGTASTGDVTVAHITVSSRNAIEVTACHDHKTLLQVPLLLPQTIHMCSTTTMPQLN